MAELRSFRVSKDLDEEIQEASGKFDVQILEIFRRAWRSYEKGNVDICNVQKTITTNGTIYKHDLGDVPGKLLCKILTVYLKKYHSKTGIYIHGHK